MYLEKMKIGEVTTVNELFYSTLSDETKSKFQLKSVGNGYVELTRVSKRYQTQSVRKSVLDKLSTVGLEKVTFDNIDLATLRVHVSYYNRNNNDVFIVRENKVFRDINKAMTLKEISQKLYTLIEIDLYKKMNDLQFKVEGFDVTMPFPFENIKERIKQMESVKHVEVMESVSEVVKTESEINLQVDNLEFIESTEIQTETEIKETDFED